MGTQQRSFQGMQTPSWQGSGGRGVNPKLSVEGGFFVCDSCEHHSGQLEDGYKGRGCIHFVSWLKLTNTELLYPHGRPQFFCKRGNIDSPDTLLDIILAERHHRLARSVRIFFN